MTPDLGNYDTVLDACRAWRDRQIALKAANPPGLHHRQASLWPKTHPAVPTPPRQSRQAAESADGH